MNGVFRNDHWPGKGRNGQKEAGGNPELETTHLSESYMILHQVCKLLPEIYSKLLQHHSPLNLLTRKHEPWNWTPLQQSAFDELKCIFSSAPVLQIPDVSRPFSIMTNTSLLAVGAVLLQTDANKDLHPCAYFSHTFTVAQWNYNIYNQELLVVILTLEEW